MVKISLMLFIFLAFYFAYRLGAVCGIANGPVDKLWYFEHFAVGVVKVGNVFAVECAERLPEQAVSLEVKPCFAVLVDFMQDDRALGLAFAGFVDKIDRQSFG